VGIISGRALHDLKSKVNIGGIIYAGNHGLEIEGPGLNFVNPIANEIKPVFRIVRQVLNMALGSFKGVFVEDKGLTLSVHYRQADESSTQAVQQIVERSVKRPPLSRLLKLTKGKKVLEVRPAVSWDKGKAIGMLINRYGKGSKGRGLLPVYIGDDLTDEDGFRIIEKYGSGISIYVGQEPRQSIAMYFLKSTDEVSLFLSELVENKPRNVVCQQFSTI
jgi:trehalose 6-phosphate phosphatase